MKKISNNGIERKKSREQRACFFEPRQMARTRRRGKEGEAREPSCRIQARQWQTGTAVSEVDTTGLALSGSGLRYAAVAATQRWS